MSFRCFAALIVLVPAALAAVNVERRDLGELYLENVPETPSELRERLAPYLEVRSAAFSGWLPDGGVLVRTRLGETVQSFRVHQPGGRREQLTFFAEPVQFALPADGDAAGNIVLLRDIGGDEDFQIFVLDPDSGQTALLSDGESRHGAVVLSRAGDRIAYYSTRRNGRDWDLYVADLASGREQRVLEVQGAWMPLEWAPDDRSLLVMRVISTAESQPFVLDLDSGTLTPIAPSEERFAFRTLSFGRSVDEVVFISDIGREFMGLFSLDRVSGEKRLLIDVDWDVTDLAVSPGGTELAFVVNEDGFGRLHRLNLSSGQALPLPPLPDGIVSAPAYRADGRALAFNFTAPNVSGDVFSIALDEQQLKRWTYSEVGGLPESLFVLPDLIRYPTFDRVDGQDRLIPAWVYRPRGEGPHPVIIEIHGGPAAQRRPGFSAIFQYWVNELGVAVVAPNVRGSTGYGRTFVALDDVFRREDSVRDIRYLLDWIAAQPDLDESRVMVYGGSYGGYMVLASLKHFGDRLAGGINIVGISNFVTFLENTRAYRRDLRRVEYGDESDPETRAFLERISPANHPDRLTRPLLVIQGLNDPRVPASESEQIIAAMRAAGHNPWYLLARNEGHGFRRQANRIARAEAESLFIQRYLLGD